MTKIHTTVKPKIRKVSIHESKGCGAEPTWDGVESLSDTQYMADTMRAISWYYQFYSRKEGQEWLAAWYHNHFPKRRHNVKLISAAKTDKVTNLLCALYPLEQNGWVPRFNVKRHIVKHLNMVIASGVERQANSPQTSTREIDPAALPTLSIQERTREQAGQMAEEVDTAIDSFIVDPDAFDPKAFKMVSLLRGKGVKPMHARYIKGLYSRGQSELANLTSAEIDVQLREAYSHIPRKNIKKLAEFYDSIMIACDQIIGEAKILKKPKTAKVKPLTDLVKKLKFLATDDKLGIASLPPVQLIGAQIALVFNVRTRKLSMYIAKSSDGLTVKGASLDNFSDKSMQKTLRQPQAQIKVLKEQTTQRKLENWFTKDVTTTDTIVTGRMNDETLIIKVFK